MPEGCVFLHAIHAWKAGSLARPEDVYASRCYVLSPYKGFVRVARQQVECRMDV